MCVGENCAPQAVHYINAQLAALYDNALSCIETHENAHKSEDRFKYSHALAEYSFSEPHSKGQYSLFQASFGTPRLEFICNHDAVLVLKINNGHYNVHYSKASPVPYRDQSLTDVELSFRVSFDKRSITGKDSKIGNGQTLIQLIVLNLPKAYLISISPVVSVGRDALAYYMSQYLTFLQSAGNHVLFSLPDFDDDRYRLTVDYTLMNATLFNVSEIHGISVEQINTYLSSEWLKAAMIIGSATAEITNWRDICAAEFRSYWTLDSESEVHFHIKLGAPRIKPVCSREAILIFSVDEVLFYDTDEAPKQRYTGWEIGVLVDVIYESESDGQVTRCKIDLTTARLAQQFCSFLELDMTDEIAVTYCSHLVEFFSASYLDILESVGLHIIYWDDKRWHTRSEVVVTSEDNGISIWGSETTESQVTIRTESWREIVTSSTMFGFDQITAISQTFINTLFNTLYSLATSVKSSDYTHSLVEWSHQDYFSASFKPITLRLLSNGRAIVWFHIAHGYLKTLKNWLPWDESEKYTVDDWHIAFEVDIRKCVHTELEEVSSEWLLKFKDSSAYKEHGTYTDRVLQHLYLDFRNAEFIHEFSSFDGLFQSRDRRPIDKVQAVVHYLRAYYLPYLSRWGLNILHTLPVWTSRTSLLSYALTDFTFQVYSKLEITRQNWAQASTTTEPVIAILGVTDFRPLPAIELDFSNNWIARLRKGVSLSTVSISQSIFTERRLLGLLARINALTTLVPLAPEVRDGVWQPQLSVWAEHAYKKDRECGWVLESEQDGRLKYKWEHRDGWNYEHEGSDGVSAAYGVSCLTRNFVELPTTFKHRALDIKVWGEVQLDLLYRSSAKQASAKSSAKWDATLTVGTDVGGVKVHAVGSLAPVFERASFAGDAALAVFADPEAELRARLPATVDFSAVLQELRAFEGIWQYAYAGTQTYCLGNPMFNLRGDVVFELRPYLTVSAPTSGRGSRQPSASLFGSLSRSSSAYPILKSPPRSPSREYSRIADFVICLTSLCYNSLRQNEELGVECVEP
ncbi:hypothetical protein WOLCODRAFT_68457 [Wolfiporia cocos MD-104 SS10]|uniref:Uncharacterized protein n=1 Tax=Wolfiporia cocos (strain MD-104) TaxID=742152 RepID=A0A2H3JF52_WOLCO|nr:hypothetical protein WOLCODRAFT_68457 [Wolfiporia cocos MD-104 SS10]